MPVTRRNKISSEEDFLSLSKTVKTVQKTYGGGIKFKHLEIPDSAKSVPWNET